MPRGVRKTVSIEEQLQKIDEQIATLQEQRKLVLEKKREEDAQKLAAFLSANSIETEDAIAYLTPTAVAAVAEEPNRLA